MVETTLEKAQQTLIADPITAVVLSIFFTAVAIEAVWSKMTDRGLYLARDAGVSFLMISRTTGSSERITRCALPSWTRSLRFRDRQRVSGR